jgi:hypothetical protein
MTSTARRVWTEHEITDTHEFLKSHRPELEAALKENVRRSLQEDVDYREKMTELLHEELRELLKLHPGTDSWDLSALHSSLSVRRARDLGLDG